MTAEPTSCCYYESDSKVKNFSKSAMIFLTPIFGLDLEKWFKLNIFAYNHTKSGCQRLARSL